MPFLTGGACCSQVGSHTYGLPGQVCLGNVTNVELLSTPIFTKEFLANLSLPGSQEVVRCLFDCKKLFLDSVRFWIFF